MTEEKRQKRSLCFDKGGMRRNRKIAFKGFLIISYSLMSFLSQENEKGMTPASMTKSSSHLEAQITVTFTT